MKPIYFYFQLFDEWYCQYLGSQQIQVIDESSTRRSGNIIKRSA